MVGCQNQYFIKNSGSTYFCLNRNDPTAKSTTGVLELRVTELTADLLLNLQVIASSKVTFYTGTSVTAAGAKLDFCIRLTIFDRQ